MKYRPEIDGLRALAVVPVVLFHAGFPVFGGGFLGVDVFFVISGFLITTLILSELDQDNFSFLKFYERRARRILPALVVMVMASIPLAWMSMSHYQFKAFAQSIVGVVMFVSNIFFWQSSGYFADTNDIIPLFHTWSLAIEEQFYIVFPLVLLMIWRRPQSILWVLLGIGLVSLMLAQWSIEHNPVAGFYLLSTRLILDYINLVLIVRF